MILENKGLSPDKEVEDPNEGLIINEVQLILAEKRTSLAALRTGIAVLVLPLSVVSVLITTSKLYNPDQVMPLILPLMILCALLVVLGAFLIVRSIRHILHQDKMIKTIKKRNLKVDQLID